MVNARLGCLVSLTIDAQSQNAVNLATGCIFAGCERTETTVGPQYKKQLEH